MTITLVSKPLVELLENEVMHDNSISKHNIHNNCIPKPTLFFCSELNVVQNITGRSFSGAALLQIRQNAALTKDI